MPSSIRTRIATAEDAERVIALYEEFTRYLRGLGDNADAQLTVESYRRDGFGPNPAFYGLVAEHDNEVIGYLLYHFGYDSELAARVMFVVDLYIAEEQRMQGAGASLMGHVESICRDSEVNQIVWSVHKLNLAARDFYGRMGGKLIDDLDFMYLEVEDQNKT